MLYESSLSSTEFCIPCFVNGTHYLLLFSLSVALMSVAFGIMYQVFKYTEWGLAFPIRIPLFDIKYKKTVTGDATERNFSFHSWEKKLKISYRIVSGSVIIFCIIPMFLVFYQILFKTQAVTKADIILDYLIMTMIMCDCFSVACYSFFSADVVRRYWHDRDEQEIFKDD